MREERVTILCGGPGLGFYVPGLIVDYQLQIRGVPTEVLVFESFLLEEKRNKIQETKIAFHRKFDVALMGQKLARDISPSLDPFLVSSLLATWRQEQRKRFVVFSGFWLPIVEKYLQTIDFPHLSIDLCHVDADTSISWKLHSVDHPCLRHVWFCNWKKNRIAYSLHVSREEPMPWHERAGRFVIHGGGWGMGTYQNKIAELAGIGLKLDVIAYEEKDLEDKRDGVRYFMIDPKWKYWEKDEAGYHQFPPFGEVKSDGKVKFLNNRQYPEVYRLIQESKAIISKPGGATLIDSLSSGTPIVLLEPFGEYENRNSLLWQHLGFGISYRDWIDTGCSLSVFDELHDNLLKARLRTQDYVDFYDATSNCSNI